MSAELREEDELVESEIFEKLSKTSRGTTEQSITNAVVVLENDSNFKNKIKLNSLSHNIELIGDTAWNRNGCAWTESDSNNLNM